MSERAQRILKVLIEKYIDHGQPVGSTALAKSSGLDLSSATIRNVMADLEEMGLIKAPHTSAGRIPTEQGYRMFVDSLLTVKPLKGPVIERIKDKLDKKDNVRNLLDLASDLLSDVTSMAGIVMLPRRVQASIRQIEFLPLSENRILAIIVINECEVENRILVTNKTYSHSQLQQTANYLNSVLAGRDLYTIRSQLVQELKNARQEVNELMATVIDLSEQLFPGKPESNFVVAGQTNLMSFSEMADIDRLRLLFEAFREKREILEIFDHCLYSQGVQIFIGSESGQNVLDECSLVTSNYTVDGQVLGVLGVIGPTRMAYERVIPIVDITAKLVGAALEFKQ